MLIWIFIIVVVLIILVSIYGILYFLDYKIQMFESNMISLFQKRTDMIPWMYEISKKFITRHNEIFREALELRKQEFSLLTISKDLQAFIQVQEKIHHEINFIFQVCNKNPKVNRDANFLYLRDCIIDQSSRIEKEFNKYKKIIEIYNSFIRYKNLSLIGLIIPYSKKTVL